MTKEKAREILNILKEYERAYQYSKEEVVGALDMAIKALEQQPCEDAISRQALIEKATSWDKHFADSERAVSLTDIMSMPPVTPQPCEDCVKRDDAQDIMARLLSDYLHDEDREKIENANEIGELPSVQPQPKSGHWIAMSEGFSPYECSECGGVEFKKSKYCPNCGCYCGGDDMREVQDGE